MKGGSGYTVKERGGENDGWYTSRSDWAGLDDPRVHERARGHTTLLLFSNEKATRGRHLVNQRMTVQVPQKQALESAYRDGGNGKGSEERSPRLTLGEEVQADDAKDEDDCEGEDNHRVAVSSMTESRGE